MPDKFQQIAWAITDIRLISEDDNSNGKNLPSALLPYESSLHDREELQRLRRTLR